MGETITFRTWLWQIVGDITRIASRHIVMGMRQWHFTVTVDRKQPIWGLMTYPFAAQIHLPGAEMLKAAGGEGTFYSPLEMLVAYRGPFVDKPVVGELYRDPWKRWTARAAQSLIAHESWLRFAWHLFHPMHLMYPGDAASARIADLAGEVWSEITGQSFIHARKRWQSVKSEVEWRDGGNPRSDFWQLCHLPGLGV